MKNFQQFAGLLLLLFMSNLAASQAYQPIYSDDFESYPEGSFLAQESPAWSPWFGFLYEEAVISAGQSLSPSKSVLVIPENDIVNDLDNRTTGKYRIRFQVYIPQGKSGYYNIMMEFGDPYTWAFDCVFFADGSGALRLEDAAAATFFYHHEKWIEVINYIDLDEDLAEVYIGDNLIYRWQYSSKTAYSSDPGIKQLAVLDLYGYDEEGLPLDSQMYVDDYEFAVLSYPIPLTDYAVYLVVLLISIFIIFRYRNILPES